MMIWNIAGNAQNVRDVATETRIEFFSEHFVAFLSLNAFLPPVVTGNTRGHPRRVGERLP
jgi:hypothetical protein